MKVFKLRLVWFSRRFAWLIWFVLARGVLLDAQVQLLNDEFGDHNTLSNWINVNEEEGNPITQLEEYNINDSSPGHLFMMPFTESWFHEYRGAYIYKYIVGDFILTTEVTAVARDGSSLPSSTFSLAGIMVREPVENPEPDPGVISGQQNYIFMSIGQANVESQSDGWNFEIKNTCHSHSCLDIDNINVNTAKIRMVRVGNEIIVLSQLPGGAWEVRNRYHRVDNAHCNGGNCNAPFPDTIQIGFVAYTDWPKVNSYTYAFHNTHTLHPDSLTMDPSAGIPFNPDLLAHFDYARFDTVPEALYSLTLTGPMAVSDGNLLTHLGFDSQAFCPENFHIYDQISGTYITVESSQSIMADNLITGQSHVTFGAGTEISLIPGFQVENQSIFQVILAGCSP